MKLTSLFEVKTVKRRIITADGETLDLLKLEGADEDVLVSILKQTDADLTFNTVPVFYDYGGVLSFIQDDAASLDTYLNTSEYCEGYDWDAVSMNFKDARYNFEKKTITAIVVAVVQVKKLDSFAKGRGKRRPGPAAHTIANIGDLTIEKVTYFYEAVVVPSRSVNKIKIDVKRVPERVLPKDDLDLLAVSPLSSGPW